MIVLLLINPNEINKGTYKYKGIYINPIETEFMRFYWKKYRESFKEILFNFHPQNIFNFEHNKAIIRFLIICQMFCTLMSLW